MHALVLSLILAGFSFAGDKLLVEVKDGNTWSKLYAADNEWRCESELTKHFYIKKKPESLSMLPLKKATEDSCAEKISIIGHEPKQNWTGCKNDPVVKEFRRQLARDCGR